MATDVTLTGAIGVPVKLDCPSFPTRSVLVGQMMPSETDGAKTEKCAPEPMSNSMSSPRYLRVPRTMTLRSPLARGSRVEATPAAMMAAVSVHPKI
jgi:hypothetical protein